MFGCYTIECDSCVQPNTALYHDVEAVANEPRYARANGNPVGDVEGSSELYMHGRFVSAIAGLSTVVPEYWLMEVLIPENEDSEINMNCFNERADSDPSANRMTDNPMLIVKAHWFRIAFGSFNVREASSDIR